MLDRIENLRKALRVAACAAVLLAGAVATTAFAGSTDLLVSWSPNTESDLNGYRLSYGTIPGSHPNTINVGIVTSYRVTGLTTGATYYFVVQAYDGAGNVSPVSIEVSGVPGGTPGPALSLSLGDSPDPINPGANLTYTLNYANNGGAGATGVVLTDTVPANTTFVSATGGGTILGSVVTWTIGALGAGSSGSVQMVVRVDNPLANGTVLSNNLGVLDSVETAALTAATATTTVSSMPVLAISNSDAPDPVAAGSNIAYTLSYSNTGTADATTTVIADTLPANTTFVSATSGGTLAAGVVTWNLGTVAAGSSGSVQLVVRVNSPLANGTVISDATFSIDCAQTAAVAGAAVATTVTSAPVLTLATADAPDPVNAGSNITYTLSYSNTGNMNASGVVITDSVPANTTFVSATGGGTQSAGVVTWSLGALNASVSGSVQMVVRANSPLANGTTITNDTASLDSAQTNPLASAAATTTVTSTPALTLSKTDSPDPVNAGANITYTLSYSNTGTASATSVVITDTVPVNTTFVSATAGGAESGGIVTWNVGAVAAAASGSVQMVVRVNSPLANGTVITNSTYSIDSAETTPVSGASVTSTVTSTPVLAISNSDAPDPVAAGSNITYTLGYSNTGTADATTTVIADTLPANATFVSATSGGTLAAGVVTWNLGTVAAGSSGSVQLVVRVNSPLANGTVISDATFSIDCAQTAAVAGAAVTTTVTSAPVFTLATADAPDPVNAGSNVTYAISYSNTGNMNASGVVITDSVPANTTFVSATSGGTQAAGVVTWNLGALNASVSGSVQMVVRANSPLANGTTITNDTASLDSAQTNPLASAAVTTTVTSTPVLTLSKTDSPDPVNAGANITYTLSYSNTGTASATSVVITDTVPVNTTFVSATAGGAESGGIVTWNVGTVAAAASGSVQMVVRVNSPLANGTVITNSTYSIDSAETTPVSGASVASTVTSTPVLAVTNSDAPDPVAAGSNITYTLSYSNTGTADATTTVIADTLPANATFVSATSGGTLAAGVVTWNLGTVAAGSSGSVQLVVRVNSPLANGTVISDATFSIDCAQTAAVAGAAVSTTVTSTPILAVSMTDSPDPVNAGSNITYTLSYSNTGNANATTTVLTAIVPLNTTFVSGTGGGTQSAGTVTWSLGTLNAGVSSAVQMVVRVNSPLANGTTIDHPGAVLDCAQTTPLTAQPVSTAVGSAPVFNLTVTDSPDPVAAGGNLTYTIGYSNTGNANASGTVLSDTLPANTTFVSATAGGVQAAGVVTWNLGAVNAGVSGSVQVVVRVNSPLANGTVITQNGLGIDSAETVASTGPTITTTVTASPTLAITATDAPDPVDAGDNVTYTLTYANTGNADATAVVLSDTLPINTTFVSATGGGTATGSVVTWTLGALAAGASGSVQLVARVASPLANGTILTHGTFSLDSAQTNPVNGTAVTTTVTSAPVLSAAMTDSPDPVNAGSNITYTLSYSNTGNANATTTVLSDTLPANTTFVSATNSGILSAGVVTWSLGTLNAGGTGSVQLVIRVTSPLADGTVITNGTYSIDSAQTTPAAGAAVTTTVDSNPTLTIGTTDAPDPVAAGANLTYTLNYANPGSATGTGVVLTDTIPANTTFVSASGGGVLSGGTVTWSLGDVLAGAVASVQLVVRVNSPLASGTVITSGTPSIDCAETAPVGGPAITTTVTSAPALTASATDTPDPVAAGANITYTLSYANNGNANATGVVLSSPVPAGTSFVSVTGGGVESAGVVTWNIGALNTGASGTVQLVVRVTSPTANGTTITETGYSIDSAQTSAVMGAATTTTVTSSPALAVAMTETPDPVNAGANITYTLSYSNSGNANATTTVLSDTLPASTTFVSATGGGTLAAGVVTWSLGTLAAGGNGSVQLIVRVASPLSDGTVITNGTCSLDSAQTSPVAAAPVTATVFSVPTLNASTTDAPDPVSAGSNLTYTFNYSNTGSTGATGVALTSAVPANTTFVSATGGGTPSAGSVTWSLGSVAVGASGSVQMVVRVTSPLASGTVITSGATSLDCAELGPISPAPISTTVTSAPVLAISKSDSPDPVAAGATLTYTLSYANNGNANATSTMMIDTVPANTTFVSATNGGTLVGGTITWNLGTLAAGGAGSSQVVVRVNSPLSNGTGITSGAYSLDCAQTAPTSGVAITTSVASSPALSVTAADAPDPVNAGGNLTYTLTYSNAGNAMATGTVLSLTLPANTSFVSATGGGVHTSGVVAWSLGNLTAPVSGSVQVVARVASPLPNGTVISLSTYSIDSNQTTSVAGPAITTAAVSNPILTLSVTDAPDPVLSGSNITYVLHYANTGNAPATGVILRATVPGNTSFVSATNGGVPSGQQVNWALGTVNAGVSASVQMVVQVPPATLAGAVINASGWQIDSNETTAVTAASIGTAVTEPSAPTVTSAVEVATNSIYVVRGTSASVQVAGTSFLNGAVVNLSPDISAGPTTVTGTTDLSVDLTLSGSATLGMRNLTLTNPDGRAGSLPGALQVVKSPDSNGDCRIDGVDLNLIARAWNNATGDPDYNAAVDLDGDGYVGPDDLTIFTRYFARKPYGCP